MQQNYKRQNVAVDVHYTADGEVQLRRLYWIDGQSYEIDRVMDSRPGASLKVGGAGTRFTVLMGGRERVIWQAGNQWFVETQIK